VGLTTDWFTGTDVFDDHAMDFKVPVLVRDCHLRRVVGFFTWEDWKVIDPLQLLAGESLMKQYKTSCLD
jgi:hypothetical protein